NSFWDHLMRWIRAVNKHVLRSSVLMLSGLMCVVFSGRAEVSDRRGRAEGLEKLEPALWALLRTSGPSDPESLPVIVPFSEETHESDWRSQAARETGGVARLERERIVFEAGGHSADSYGSLPAAAAIAGREALARLAVDPRVARISVDHAVQGNLHTTALAVGADQAWTGSPGRPGVTERRIAVAVLDSGFEQAQDLKKTIRHSKSFNGDTKDKYGHGTHVAGIISGDGANSSERSGFAVQYRGIAPDADLLNVKVLDKW